MRLEHGLIGTAAHRLRRFERVHRILQWMRRCLGSGVVEGWVEFLRWFFARSETFGPALHGFSVYQALRSGYPKTRGRIILEDQGNPVVAPGGLLATGGYMQHAEQPWPIVWSEHSSARLVSESLALMQGKRVCLESVYGHKHFRNDPACRLVCFPPPTKLHGTWTSIVSRWTPTTGRPNYTHWLLDALPRLALLSEFPPETGILVPSALYASQKESLSLLNVLGRSRFTAETHLQVERYFFSGPTTMLQGYNPYGVKFLRTALLPKRDAGYAGPKRFFIQRTGDARNIENEEETLEFFTRLGWGVVHPAKLTFAQQMQLFWEAEAICGTIGSGFTNGVFCQPGCKWVLLAQDFMLDGWLEWISQVVKTEFRFLICHTGYGHKISVDLAALERTISELGLAA